MLISSAGLVQRAAERHFAPRATLNPYFVKPYEED
jgi:hypothetical protein